LKHINNDPLSPELRLVEKDIDNYYKNNLLCKIQFAEAAWFFLAFCEDIVIKEFNTIHKRSIHEYEIIFDNIINHMNFPLLWLKRSCTEGGKIPFCLKDDYYQAAWDLLKLSEEYFPFTTVFTYASHGIIDLELKDNLIIPHHDFILKSKYEAYNRLVKPSTVVNDHEYGDINEIVSNSLKISGGRFKYQLNPKIIKRVLEICEPHIDIKFSLPNDWQFTNYSMGEFNKVSKVLYAIATLHFIARRVSINSGCEALGFADSLIIQTSNELIRRITRYSSVIEHAVSHILDDLTYGNKQIDSPDPAIQPLIKLNSNQYAIVPNLIINSSVERNFTILLNKLPSERDIYSRLVSEKEKLMRIKIQEEIKGKNVRFFHGKIPSRHDLPDIDLALISDIDKVCIFMELKWFIDPAEVREILEKSEEIEKGISQLNMILQTIDKNPKQIFEALGIDSTYKLCFIVVSENWIGFSKIQDSKVPAIKCEHLLKKIKETKDLNRIIDWLNKREFLPKLGSHYEIVEKIYTIGKWSTKWYGVKPLIHDVYI